MPRLYLDVCCFNRPFDDQSQSRIRIETEAVLAILERCQIDEWELISSEVVETEVAQIADQEQRQRIEGALQISKSHITINNDVEGRATTLQGLGFHAFDAMHVACAEMAQVDVFLTTDDRLLRKGIRYSDDLTIVSGRESCRMVYRNCSRRL